VNARSERRGADRRSPYGDVLFACVRDADTAETGGTVSMDDLVRAVARRGARLSEVADWIAQARSSGVIEDAGFATDESGRLAGPRRFRIGPAGRQIVANDRRLRERRR
jgi:hypothetical protein